MGWGALTLPLQTDVAAMSLPGDVPSMVLGSLLKPNHCKQGGLDL